jgi:hypothetical protein
MNPNELLAMATSLIQALYSGTKASDLNDEIQRLGNMTQLSTIASDEKGREGYAAVAEMMKKTGETIGVICERVNVLIGQLPGSSATVTAAIHAELNLLGTLLQRLGEIAPIGPWTTTA